MCVRVCFPCPSQRMHCELDAGCKRISGFRLHRVWGLGALGFRVELRLRILTNAGGIAYGVLARSLAGDATETPWKGKQYFL